MQKHTPMMACLLASLTFSTTTTARDLNFAMQDYPPFYFQESQEKNHFKGAAIEVTKTICDQLKIHCSFNVITFARLLVDLKANAVDGAPFIVNDPQNNPERTAFINFSTPIFLSNYSYMGIKGDSKHPQKIEDLSGWTIGVVRNSYGEKLSKKATQIVKDMVIMPETTVTAALNKLQNNRYGAHNKSGILFSEDVALYYAKSMGMDNLVTLFTPEKKIYSIGFSKKVDAQTLQDFNKAIDEMKKSGALKKIANDYGVMLAE